MPRPPYLTRRWIIAVLMLTSFVVFADGSSKPSENAASTIQYLLKYVADSGLMFIRNAESHSAADAAKHMNDKYRYYKKKIETAEDFIRLCASKSLITGKPYLVVMENGDEARTDDWLLEALANYRNDQAANTD